MLLVGIGVAAWIAVLGLAVLVCVVLVAWITAAHHSDALAPALATAVAAWLLAQHCALSVDGGGSVSIVPLTLTFLLGALLVRGGRQAARLTECDSPRGVVALAFAVAVPYSIAGAALTRVVEHAGVRANPVQGAVGPLVLALACVGLGGLRETRLTTRASSALPGWSMAVLRSGAAALAIIIGTSAAATAIALVGHSSRVATLTGSLHPGPSGTALLAVVSAAYLPNAVAWTASFAVGPGFAVGTGTSVSLFGVHLGAVPALPLLAPLPQTGHAPGIDWLVVVGVLAAGVVGGWLIGSRSSVFSAGPDAPEWLWWRRYRLPDAGLALAAGATCGMLLGVVGWLSGGALGPGRMSDVGPRGLLVGLAAAAEVGIVAALVVVAMAWRARSPAVLVLPPDIEPEVAHEQLAFDTSDVTVVEIAETDPKA